MLIKGPNKNTHYNVKNLHGTSGLRCRCGSWISHWKNNAHSDRTVCAVVGCGRHATVGAHVISVDRRNDHQWWIAPFCSRHNNYRFDENVFLDSRITLVSANKSYTCTK